MNVFEIPTHQAADLFPLFDKARFDELKDDIAEHGQREAIKLFNGAILDGRNRYNACCELGMDPITETLPSDTNPWAYVWSLNGQRRDLVQDQRYLLWKRCSENGEDWIAEQARIAQEANRKRSEVAKERPRNSDGTLASDRTTCAATGSHSDVGREAAAKASNTNRGSVERMNRLDRERPDLADKVLAGEIRSAEAMRLMRKDTLKDRAAALPSGKYRVVYADPPWSYNDSRQLADYDSTTAVYHYPTMSTADICAMDVKDLAADDAVLFLWGTFPLLEDAIPVIEAWGFEYKTCFIWDKGSGSFGHYHNAEAEILFVATRGSAIPDSDKREPQVIAHPRLGHSRKPDCFREMVDRMYSVGPRIELFARGEPTENWTTWGNEADKAA